MMAHVIMGPLPTEAQEQRTLFEWAAVMSQRHPVLRLMHHIPNGGSRNPAEARNLRAQGVRPSSHAPGAAAMGCISSSNAREAAG